MYVQKESINVHFENDTQKGNENSVVEVAS
jgi:hypothetical protein